jgi:hypothetical protein
VEKTAKKDWWAYTQFIWACTALVGTIASFTYLGLNSKQARADQPLKARLTWPIGQPRPDEVSRVCPSEDGKSTASSSLNFIINEKTGGQAYADVEFFPACLIEYTIAGNKTIVTFPWR